MEKIYNIIPVAKPRMTRRDKIKHLPPRPIVARYWAYKAEVRRLGIEVPTHDYHIIFVMPMYPSWPKKKKAEMWLRPHQQNPDVDNLCKGHLDAIYGDDKVVYDIRCSKAWGYTGAIIVRESLESIDGYLKYLSTEITKGHIKRGEG